MEDKLPDTGGALWGRTNLSSGSVAHLGSVFSLLRNFIKKQVKLRSSYKIAKENYFALTHSGGASQKRFDTTVTKKITSSC